MSKTISSENRQRRLHKSKRSKRTRDVSNTVYSAMESEGFDQSSMEFASISSRSSKSSQLSDALKAEILKSPDTVVEIIYPLLGKILKKYIQNKFSRLKHSFRRIIKWSNSEHNNAINGHESIPSHIHPQIEKVLFIDDRTNSIISEVSNSLEISNALSDQIRKRINKRLEHGEFNRNEIQLIQFEAYSIHLQFFSEFYAAIILSGPYNWAHKDLLEDKLMHFAQRIMEPSDKENNEMLTKKLGKYFKKSELKVD